MEDFDFLGDGSGSQSAPKSKFERDLEKFGDMSKLKDAKKNEEERLKQAGKFYDISEKENTDIPLPKPDSLKRRGNIDRDELITSAVPTLTDDDDSAPALSPAEIAAAEMAAEEAAEAAAQLAAEAVAALGGAPAVPNVSYGGSATVTSEPEVIVVKNESDDDDTEPAKPVIEHDIAPRQDNGLPVLADLSDEWLQEAAKSMGYKDVVLSDREKEQLRQKENVKIATNLEKSLKEKTRISTSEYTEGRLKSAKVGQVVVFVCAGLCIALGLFSWFFMRNVVIQYAGAALVVFAGITLIKVRFLSRLLKAYLLVCLFAYIFAGLLSEMYAAVLTNFDLIAYTVGVVVCLTVLGILLFAPSVAKYYQTDFRKAERQI
ncbi:MAG: hypothetical protein LBL87_03580 [Ruminococcus sp.]|jgi:hypothetical protein|nr:hypothetical protein [Ruminococcus sp.]